MFRLRFIRLGSTIQKPLRVKRGGPSAPPPNSFPAYLDPVLPKPPASLTVEESRSVSSHSTFVTGQKIICAIRSPGDVERFMPQVHQDDPDFSTVIAIDRSRGIQDHDPFFQGKPAPGPYLGFVSLWNLQVKSRSHKAPRTRLYRNGLDLTKIHSRCPRSRIIARANPRALSIPFPAALNEVPGSPLPRSLGPLSLPDPGVSAAGTAGPLCFPPPACAVFRKQDQPPALAAAR